jgi:DNA-binding NarL/FixJ family response regulator
MHPQRKLLAALFLSALVPTTAGAAWQVISAEPGKRVEIDRSSIRKENGGKSVAEGRIILDKPIVDAKTSSSYRIVQALNRYDCTLRNYSTLKRSYFKEEGQLLREEEVKVPIEMPVRSGMLDDKLLREVCRPKPGPEAAAAASRTADKVNEAAGELRKANCYDFDVLGATDNIEELRVICLTKPDLLVVDLRMKPMDGISLITQLRNEGVAIPVVMLTMSDSETDLANAIRAGVRGYLLKDMAPEDVVDSIRRVAAGELVVAPAMTVKMIDLLRGAQPGQEPRNSLKLLTEREREIIQLLARGESNKTNDVFHDNSFVLAGLRLGQE